MGILKTVKADRAFCANITAELYVTKNLKGVFPNFYEALSNWCIVNEIGMISCPGPSRGKKCTGKKCKECGGTGQTFREGRPKLKSNQRSLEWAYRRNAEADHHYCVDAKRPNSGFQVTEKPNGMREFSRKPGVENDPMFTTNRNENWAWMKHYPTSAYTKTYARSDRNNIVKVKAGNVRSSREETNSRKWKDRHAT